MYFLVTKETGSRFNPSVDHEFLIHKPPSLPWHLVPTNKRNGSRSDKHEKVIIIIGKKRRREDIKRIYKINEQKMGY
jgi:hypothetical protein